MPVIINNNKSLFELTNFDSKPATIDHQGQTITPPTTQAAGILSDSDIRDLAGAPAESTVTYCNVQNITYWGALGDDRPPLGLYLFVEHSTWIGRRNAIGLIWTTSGYEIYIKDVDFNDSAPKGLAGIMLAKIVRFCLKYKIQKINLFAAGGRSWEDMDPSSSPPGRWGGYYVWARCGFDMPLSSWPYDKDTDLFPFFQNYPANLASCTSVQSVIEKPGGLDWWRACGNGWFMSFDCSGPTTPSMSTLEAYLKEKSL